MEKIIVPVFHFWYKPLCHDAAFTQELCHPFTRGVTGFVIVKAQIDDLRIRFQHLHHRNWGRAAASNIAVLLPLLRVHGDNKVGVSGILTKGNGDASLMSELNYSLSCGGGQAGQGYPCVLTAAFSAGAGASAGTIGYAEEVRIPME